MKESAGRVLMLVENYFPADPRVRNEAFTLIKAGYEVTVVCLKKKAEKFKEEVQGVRVYRIPTVTFFKNKKKDLNRSSALKLLTLAKSVTGYGLEYFYFTFACLLLSVYVAFTDGFDVIHAHNPPDTLFVVSAIYRPFGKKFIFDHHDLAPELYRSRFGAEDGFVTKGLLWLEKRSLRCSDVSIATNRSYKEFQVQRGKRKPEEVFIVRNGPDLNRLRPGSPDLTLHKMGKTILLYLGEMNPQDGVDYLLRALAHLRYTIGRTDFYCILIGKGDSTQDLANLARDLKLSDFVRFTGYVPDNELLHYLSSADICLDPNPSSPLNDVSTWIKVMEYMAMGKPIVSFDLKETRYTAQQAAIYVTPNDEAEFARAITKLMDDPKLREQMGKFGRQRVEAELNWEIESKNLLQAYASLTV